MVLNQTIIDELEKEYRETLRVVSKATDEETQKQAISKLEALHKQLIDQRKLELEGEKSAMDNLFRNKQAKIEEETKDLQLKGEKQTRIGNWILGGITAATSIVGMVLTNKWLKTTMRFEETGTFTSKSSRFVTEIKRIFNKG